MGGIIHSRLEILVKDGPYRYIRHPVCLGITIAFYGIPIAMRSWPGLIAVFLLFLPSKIYRAKLEEKALAKKFGGEWKSYALRTGFFLPFIGKSK
jgi:protein-S-isoprenylcysteine O-methyltransferase Ste14